MKKAGVQGIEPCCAVLEATCFPEAHSCMISCLACFVTNKLSGPDGNRTHHTELARFSRLLGTFRPSFSKLKSKGPFGNWTRSSFLPKTRASETLTDHFGNHRFQWSRVDSNHRSTSCNEVAFAAGPQDQNFKLRELESNQRPGVQSALSCH